MLRALLAFTYRKRLPARFGGARVRVTPRADARLLRRGWEGIARDLMLVADRMVRPGDAVWDIGANQGIFAFLAAYRAGPGGAVRALEADPAYADMAFRSAAALGPSYAPVEVLCAAIADAPGVLLFAVSSRGHARSHLVGHGGGDAAPPAAAIRSVVAVTGDGLLAHWPAPALVKIDVEGAELAALEGCARLLRDVRPVLYVEVSERNADAVTARLRAAGYALGDLQGDGSVRPAPRCTFHTVAWPEERGDPAARAQSATRV
ncbi:FkbM family methyltransferase [Jannaschia sp. W003]|uniref:FkbM family methyltransferase n=1 Tax=Jannaschia sp. W003 TaxID=2867012 RepID=UPI0021A95135|nr:FkbM family methyltransferase [Jannaschia sp. W003]UWQ20458.1 FkbM family methyltransferase [Jannaschia sp. W003]